MKTSNSSLTAVLTLGVLTRQARADSWEMLVVNWTKKAVTPLRLAVTATTIGHSANQAIPASTFPLQWSRVLLPDPLFTKAMTLGKLGDLKKNVMN